MLLDLALDAIYPPRCPLCDAFAMEQDIPCSACGPSLVRLEGDAYLPHLPRRWFSRCRSPFAHEGRPREALHSLKYGERFDLARFFASELAREAAMIEGMEAVVPVPLHPRRLRERGFNQSALIASRLGRTLRVAADLDSLRRVRDIAPQVGLDRHERIENVKGAFAVHPRRAGSLSGRGILLIDDVLTTGATANECARALIEAGAKGVSVLTVARAL